MTSQDIKKQLRKQLFALDRVALNRPWPQGGLTIDQVLEIYPNYRFANYPPDTLLFDLVQEDSFCEFCGFTSKIETQKTPQYIVKRFFVRALCVFSFFRMMGKSCMILKTTPKKALPLRLSKNFFSIFGLGVYYIPNIVGRPAF